MSLKNFLAGGLLGLKPVRKFLFGEKAQEKSKPVYNPQQRAFLDNILSQVQAPTSTGINHLQSLLNRTPQSYSDFSLPYRRDFERKTMPTIAERFTGGLGTGSQRSSAFGQALGEAGRDLDENILARAWQNQMQQDSQDASIKGSAISQLMGYLNPSLAQREHQYTIPRRTGLIENLGTAAAKGLGEGVGAYVSGGVPKLMKSLFEGGQQETAPSAGSNNNYGFNPPGFSGSPIFNYPGNWTGYNKQYPTYGHSNPFFNGGF